MKNVLKIIVLLIVAFTVSGCKNDSMEDITIYTTTYPIEYITDELYGEYSYVSSVYPNEVIKLSDKLISDYSSGDLFVYNGLSNEKDYAVKMLNKNKNLKIVDATMGMEIENSVEELWLNPSNFLMLCLNIRNGMKEYISNNYLRKVIDDNYNELKLSISELDAEIKLLVENADDSTILVSNDVFKYLEKYNVNVISLENNENLNEKVIATATENINNGKIKHIIMLKDDTLTDSIESLIQNNKIEKIYFNSLTSLSNDDDANGKNYITLMKENLEILKQELYDEKETIE